MKGIKKYYIGDSCYCIQLSNTIDIEISNKILCLYKLIKNNSKLKTLGVFDTVPSYNSLAVHFDSSKNDVTKIITEINSLIEISSYTHYENNSNSFVLNVDYNGEDLARVATFNNLTIEDVIEIHSSSVFTVAMIGFIPFFPYLIGLDKRIITPRLDNPRNKVPKGSVAIGGAQTGIYPQESPGGWNLIGITDTNVLKKIQPGDKIKFIPAQKSLININCDIGENGAGSPVDDEIMQYINIANIAAGGHAGDIKSVKYYRELAEKNNVKVSVHLSYSDKDNFGRKSLDISYKDLETSLNKQYELMPDIKTIKLHGALYNDCWTNKKLANFVCKWMKSKDIIEVIAPESSALADLCKQDNIKVIAEVFAERNYQYITSDKILKLIPRTNKYAIIENCDSAVNHVREILKNKAVNAFIDDSSEQKLFPVKSDTFCVHSDSSIALELIKKITIIS